MSETTEKAASELNKVFEILLNIQINKKGEISYNNNFGLAEINNEILRQIDFSVELLPPNIVILKPCGSPNDDNEILNTTKLYKEDFLLDDDNFLDICADEAIFRRLI